MVSACPEITTVETLSAVATGNQVWPIRICIVLLRKQLIRDTEAPALFLLHTPTEYNYSLLRLIAITRILGFDYFHVTEDSILIHRM